MIQQLCLINWEATACSFQIVYFFFLFPCVRGIKFVKFDRRYNIIELIWFHYSFICSRQVSFARELERILTFIPAKLGSTFMLAKKKKIVLKEKKNNFKTRWFNLVSKFRRRFIVWYYRICVLILINYYLHFKKHRTTIINENRFNI